MFKSEKNRKGFFAAMKDKEDQPDDDISMADDAKEKATSRKGSRIEKPHAGRKAKPIPQVGVRKLKKSIKPLSFKGKKDIKE